MKRNGQFIPANRIVAAIFGLALVLVLAITLVLRSSTGLSIQRALSPAITPELQDPPSGLFEAAASGNADLARALIAAGADVNATADWMHGVPQGGTPIHAAAMAGQEEVLRVLAASGADLEAETGQGLKALDVAMPSVIGVLVDLGADPDNTDSRGMTALFAHAYAWAEGGGPAGVRALIKAGADPTIRDSQGRTVVDYVSGFGVPSTFVSRLRAELTPP